MKKRVTSQQVAARAGVSRTTVSFVLNDAPLVQTIPEETRARVLQAARELGYVPNSAARTLASGQTRTLGLLLPDPDHLEVDAFIPQLLYGLTAVCNERGFRVIVEGMRASSGDAYLSLIDARQIDGLVVLNPHLEDASVQSELIRSGFPLVSVDEAAHVSAYTVAQRSLAREAVNHLVRLGHKRIAHITYASIAYQGALGRLKDYKQTLKEAGLEADERLVRYGGLSARSGYEAMVSLLEDAPPFTALFAGNDTIALGAMAALRQRGLRVPEDVAVVGYDDIPTAAFAAPPLTTVRTHPRAQGRRVGEVLIQLVQGKTPPLRNVCIENSELIVRESCGAVREEDVSS